METSDPASFDREAVLANVDNDLNLLRELADLLVEDTPRLLEAIRNGLEDEDLAAIWNGAHAIKGAVANFGARPAQALAEAIEQLARSHEAEGTPADLPELERYLARLEEELDRLFDDLQEFVAR
jgi:HPt (histidine-containing phosphotransfer) domain-containing protein